MADQLCLDGGPLLRGQGVAAHLVDALRWKRGSAPGSPHRLVCSDVPVCSANVLRLLPKFVSTQASASSVCSPSSFHCSFGCSPRETAIWILGTLWNHMSTYDIWFHCVYIWHHIMISYTYITYDIINIWFHRSTHTNSMISCVNSMISKDFKFWYHIWFHIHCSTIWFHMFRYMIVSKLWYHSVDIWNHIHVISYTTSYIWYHRIQVPTYDIIHMIS